MSTSLKYNPGLLTDDELIRAFVVRKHDLDLLTEMVEQNSTAESNQHILVTGQRGIGKTTLVRRTAIEIRSNPDLNMSWVPIVFAEETYSATDVAELWLEALLRLYNQTNDDKWLDSYKRIRSETNTRRACDAALSALLEFADERKTKLVLIVENFSMLIHQFDTNANWELRHTLSNERRLMLIATAPAKFSEADDVDAAWFQFFVIHELKPLSVRQCTALWKSLTGKVLPVSQARAIEILTGGNPRLIRILTEFAIRKSFHELVNNLTGLIDEHTEYFKSQIDVLPPAERKVLVALLEAWKPAEAREVAELARLEVNKTSALLSRLVSERGLVTIKTGERKRRRYEVSERLFNIYYLMRRQGHPADRVRAAVRFMVVLYRDSQLVDTVTRLASEACGLDPGLRIDYFNAYEEVIRCDLKPSLRSAIIDATPQMFARQMPKRLTDLIAGFEKGHQAHSTATPTTHSTAQKFISQAIQAVERNDLAGAEKILLAAIEADPNDGHIWSHLGDVLIRQDKLKEGVDALREAVRLGCQIGAWGWGKISNALHEMGNYREAAEASRKVVSLEEEPTDKADALGILGHLVAIHLDQIAEGEALLNEALSLDPDNVYACLVLSQIRLGQSAPNEAQVHIGRALESSSRVSSDWMLLADFCHKNGYYAESEVCLKRTLQFEPDNAKAWADLTELLWFHLSRKDEAEAAIRQSIKLNDKDADTHARLAMMLRTKGNLDEAEAEATAAIKLNDKCGSAWSELGTLHYQKLNFPESEKALLNAIKLDSDDFALWCELGLTLEALGRLSEAKSAFTTSAELSKQFSKSFASLPKDHGSFQYGLHALYTLSLALGRRRDWPEALGVAHSFIDAAKTDERALSLTTDFIIRSAANNQVTLAIEALEASSAREAYEPLLAALKILNGENVDCPLEIAEVAHDIVKRVLSARNEAVLRQASTVN